MQISSLSSSVRIQPDTIDLIDKIVELRKQKKGYKPPKTQIIAEAIKALHETELAG